MYDGDDGVLRRYSEYVCFTYHFSVIFGISYIHGGVSRQGSMSAWLAYAPL